MKGSVLSAVSVLAVGVAAKGSPVLAERATSTLSPVTITGNGTFSLLENGTSFDTK
jgi:hypothetical protein